MFNRRPTMLLSPYNAVSPASFLIKDIGVRSAELRVRSCPEYSGECGVNWRVNVNINLDFYTESKNYSTTPQLRTRKSKCVANF